jgi:hypothetical protein
LIVYNCSHRLVISLDSSFFCCGHGIYAIDQNHTNLVRINCNSTDGFASITYRQYSIKAGSLETADSLFDEWTADRRHFLEIRKNASVTLPRYLGYRSYPVADKDFRWIQRRTFKINHLYKVERFVIEYLKNASEA